ncbi:3-oxoacyl-ACP reductase FabG [Lachnotalea glycerini]|uniref:SDR family oxidoreductase n=1 Tax=Lachnotalea glycerini TaxID=1763509 RepID=A0A371JGY2_9FIRM|nr:3-oxoacyl-ACP reductase FabG [Lachnotalea glycerini]RDY31937.1 SDR family oxidoreductase [Lachnotalea glycerini]
MFESLVNRVAVVSGGSSGIGKAVVRLLAEKGMKVALLYNSNPVDEIELYEVAESEIIQFQVDVKSFESVKSVFKSIEKAFGTIDFLVNSAGVVEDSYMFLMSEEKFDKVVDTNLKGNFLLMQAVISYLLEKEKGAAIVNISSIAGIKGVAGQTNYCATKFGIIGMTKALAKEVAYKNIRVNAIAPGYIETKMTQNLSKEEIEKIIPMRRMGSPEEIAKVVLFLISDGASYINGETIVVDGGIIA